MSRSQRILLAIGLMIGVALIATEAQASESVCKGQAPAIGAVLKGPVLYIPDGERLCVAQDGSPQNWVEVQVLDARPGAASGDEGHRRLMAAAFARNADCVVTGESGERVTAACMIEGERLSARLNQSEIIKAAQAWR